MKINQKTKEANSHRYDVDKFYNTKQWARLRDAVWERDEYTCQICKAKGVLHFLQRGTKDITHQGTVDHIKPRNVGGSDDMDNLRLVGSRCHAKKSNEDKKYYK